MEMSLPGSLEGLRHIGIQTYFPRLKSANDNLEMGGLVRPWNMNGIVGTQ
jgi:hypothetical protein